MKLLVQLSGGLDSAAALLWARARGNVYCVFYDWGQPYATVERQAAVWLADQFNLPFRNFNVPLLTDVRAPVLEYIPYRNLILTAHSLNLAAAERMDLVVVGCKTKYLRAEDPYSFKDSCEQFVTDLNRLVHDITEPLCKWPQIVMPLTGWEKAQVLDSLQAHKIDADRLWTCYGPGPEPCGVCYHCKVYQEAKVKCAASL